jgi:hypothetical protein
MAASMTGVKAQKCKRLEHEPLSEQLHPWFPASDLASAAWRKQARRRQPAAANKSGQVQYGDIILQHIAVAGMFTLRLSKSSAVRIRSGYRRGGRHRLPPNPCVHRRRRLWSPGQL